ncbi:MAG: hypothetical protein QOI73_524 [Solirubrobacteraceae bacterium]|nr:hypothetical protein [Solirubrobacteraceae bacterium]
MWANAATLTFGLCCNHPFHNGNKRTALVSMIAHLEKNGHTIFGIKHDELYWMIKEVAKHSLGDKPQVRGKPKPITGRDADAEVAAIATWLRKRARRIERQERRITARQLRQILGQHGLEMKDPKGNSITIYRVSERRTGLRMRKVPTYERICNIAYRGETQPVG